MKITKSQLKQIIKEEISKALSEGEFDIGLGIDADPSESPLDNILNRLADPAQREQVKTELEQSGALQLDPIEDKEKIKSIINVMRSRSSDEVLDFILVKIADEVLKVSV